MKSFTHQRASNILVLLSLAMAIVLVIAVDTLRFYKTDQIPYGFHVDELSGAVTTQCLGTEGVDAHNKPYPLFSDLHYGTPKPPTYIYPAMLWGKAFGYSVPSLRRLSAASFTLGIVGLFFLARFFFGSSFAIWTVLIGSLSPWMWVPSRVAVESLFAPTFLIWGLYVFLRFRNVWAAMAAGFLFSCAVYSYPPFRAYVPLMLVTLGVYTYRAHRISRLSWGILLTVMILTGLPLAQKTISGEIQGRFNQISIASSEYLQSIGKTNSPQDLLQIFTNNYLLHFSPDFLFFNGDPSYVHSMQHFGVLGWLDLLGLACLFLLGVTVLLKKSADANPWKTDRSFLIFILANIALGIVPSAMTNTELPNSLRIIAAWPFVCLLTAYGIWRMSQRWPLVVPLSGVLVAAIFAAAFLKVYFYQYPKEAAGMFSFWTKDEAEQIKDDTGWLDFVSRYRADDYHSRYYLMNYRGDSCRESKATWEDFRKLWRFFKID